MIKSINDKLVTFTAYANPSTATDTAVVAAVRALLAGEDKGTKRGRPTKEEKERQLKIDESIRETLSEDMQRLGLTVVK